MPISQFVEGLGGSDMPSPLGHMVKRRGTTDLAAVAEVDLFTIAGGDILLTALVGRVTTALSADNTLIQLHHTPTISGVQEDLCAEIGAHIASDPVGSMYTITGAHNVAMTANVGVEGQAVASFATNLDILVAGVISLDVTAFANTGVIEWTIHYVPLNIQTVVSVTP